MDLRTATLKLFTSRILSAIFEAVGIVLFARALGANQLGTFFLFQAVLGLSFLPADLGIGEAIEKRISEGRSPDRVLGTGIALKSIPLTLVALSVLIFRNQLNAYIGGEFAVLLAVTLVVREFSQLWIYVLRGELRVGETATIQIVRQSVWILLGGVFVFSGTGVVGLVYSLLVGHLVAIGIGVYKTDVHVGSPSRQLVSPLFQYSKYHFVTLVGDRLYDWIDVAIIGWYLTQSHVGAYEVAWRVTAVFALLGDAIAITLLPQVSSWSTDDALKQVENVIPFALLPSFLLVVPALFGTVLFGERILLLLFGSSYTIAWLALIILMAGRLFQGPHTIFGHALRGLDKPDFAAKAGLVTIGFNLVANLVLIGWFGLPGAAVATAGAFTASAVLQGTYLQRLLRIGLPYREVGWSIVSSLGMTGGLILVQSVHAIETLPALLVAISLGAVLYAAFVLSYSPIRHTVSTQIRSLV